MFFCIEDVINKNYLILRKEKVLVYLSTNALYMIKMKVVEYYYKYIKAKGINRVFGIPGSYIMPLWQQFSEPNEIKLVLARHENGAVFMADGWSRVNRQVGIVLTTIGPGITNAITGIATAYYDSIPLVVISGYSSLDEINKGGFQNSKISDRGFSVKKLLKGITKANFFPKNVEEAISNIHEAFCVAQEGRKGPVHILLPKDIQCQEFRPKDMTFAFEDESSTEICISKNICDTIEKAKRPILFSGWGVYLADGINERNKFVSKYNIPFVCSTKGLAGGQAVEKELFWGVTGTVTKLETIKKIKDYAPDLWIVVGSSLSQNSFVEFTEVCNSDIIQVDIDSGQKNQYMEAQFFLRCDAKQFFKKINNCIEGGAVKYNFPPKINKKPCFFFEKVLNSLVQNVKKEAIIVPDAGNHWLDVLYWFPQNTMYDIRTNAGLASMGHAIGASIGMKLANRDREVICITGDGSFLMSGAEISVAIQEEVKILFLVYNNSGLGRVRVGQGFTGKYIASNITNVSIADIGIGMGAKAVCVKTVKEFQKYLKLYLNSNDTWIIEICEKKDAIPAILREREEIC